LNVILFKVAITFKCHVYLLCIIIIALKCRKVIMGMNDNWTILEVATFANLSHFGCDAYWEKHLWECRLDYIWSKRHYLGMMRHASWGHLTTFMAKTTPKQPTQNVETTCLICPYSKWIGDNFVMTKVNEASHRLWGFIGWTCWRQQIGIHEIPWLSYVNVISVTFVLVRTGSVKVTDGNYEVQSHFLTSLCEGLKSCWYCKSIGRCANYSFSFR
jgi:hypothetical protein